MLTSTGNFETLRGGAYAECISASLYVVSIQVRNTSCCIGIHTAIMYSKLCVPYAHWARVISSTGPVWFADNHWTVWCILYTLQVPWITNNRILSKQVGPAEVLLTSALVKPTALLRHRNHVFGLLPCKPTWQNSGKPDVSSNIANEMWTSSGYVAWPSEYVLNYYIKARSMS